MNFNRMPLHPPFHPPSHLPPNAGPPNMPPNPGHMPQGMPPGPMPPPHLPPHIGGAELGRGDGMPMQGHFPNQVNKAQPKCLIQKKNKKNLFLRSELIREIAPICHFKRR